METLQEIEADFKNIDKWHHHEILDRTMMISDMFDQYIGHHPLAEHPELREAVNRISEDLADLYQAIGDLMPLEKDEKSDS